nr:putative ribonuclease H-like domain-containing protein [Tanacetum cinerariifolium]
MQREILWNSSTFNIWLNAGSKSAPLSAMSNTEPGEKLRQMRQSSVRKLNTYVLPTPLQKATRLDTQQPSTTNMWHSSPLECASLDRRSTIRGYQFLGSKLISWQCKKQTIMANSTTKTKIHMDNESAICVVKNPVYHSKTKHIEIRLHFIRDSYEKRLIEIVKIHTDYNVADLLIKAFDVTSIKVTAARSRLELKGYLINDGYANLVQHAGDYFNILKVNAARPKLKTVRVYAAETKVKKVNDEVRIQALLDGKKGWGYENPSDKLTFYKDFFSPQWKFLIHTILQCLSAKTTSWNEFSSNMASAIICLATNQNSISQGTGFSGEVTPLFDNILVQDPEKVGILQANAQPIPIPTGPSTSKPQKKHKPKRKHTKEPKDSLKLKELMDLCTNLSNKFLDLKSEVIDIKSTYKSRIEKLESRVERLEEKNGVLKGLKGVHSTVDSNEPVMKKEKSFKQGRKIADIDANVEINLEKVQAEAYNLDLDHQEKVLSMLDVNDEEPTGVEEVLELVKAAKLITEVVTTAGVDVNVVSVQDTPITAAKATKVQAKDKGKAILIEEPKPLKRQMQIDLDEEVTRQLEVELNADINWNAVIEQVKKSESLTDAVMKYQDLKRKPLTEAQARRNMIVYLKNMAGYKMNYFKGMSYNEIRPLFEKHYNLESSKREDESLEQEIAKKQKMEQENEELKKHLHIVLDDDDDDVYTDATPLASKIPIVDYKIHTERNIPYFKIISTDGNHRLFMSFSIIMKNFDREDLESLWKIVRERFEKTEPKNFSDDYLLNTFKIMFEKPNVEANVWKDQRDKYGLSKVKSWKLFESFRVHYLTLSTT